MTVIAIDGPSGSGKSTIARALAAKLGLDHLDTGAMYRGVTFAVLQRGLDPADADAVGELSRSIALELDGGTVLVDGHDATVAIRGPEVTGAVSVVAANPDVRAELVRRQRAWLSDRGGGVVEGRDIGTVVCPDAQLKVYLTADLTVRAERRGKEMGEATHDAVAADIARRDTFDSTREASPLAVAPDAVHVDTSDRSIDDIVTDLLERL